MIKIVEFVKKYIEFVVASILFTVPFFWYDHFELDTGGDSSRLYFIEPYIWMKNIGLYSPNVLTGFGTDVPNFFMVPFLSLLTGLKFILFNNGYLLNIVFQSLLLSGSFLSMYLIICELLNNNNVKYNRIIAVFIGLFFVLSPLNIYEWKTASYYYNQIFIYLLLFYFLIKYINTYQYKYIVYSLITTFIFSVNFSFATTPWFFAFFPATILFLLIYSIINDKLNICIKGLAVFFVLFVLVNLFQLLPLIINVADPSNYVNQVIFNQEGKIDRGLGYFLSVQPYVRLIYNIINQPQYYLSTVFGHPTVPIVYEYGIKYMFLFFIYPIIITFGILSSYKFEYRKNQKVFFSILIIFLILLFFMTANINDWLLSIYKSLFYLPGFSMFRSFYTKFALVYVFFYSLALAYSLYFITLSNRYNKKFNIIFFLLFVLVIYNGWPLLSGKIVNQEIWLSKNVKSTNEFTNEYWQAISTIQNTKLDTKISSFPWTNEAYQLIRGKNGGVYFGPSSFAIFGGINDFNGLESFSPFSKHIVELVKANKTEEIKKLFGFFNIGIIVFNNDDYIYDNFHSYPYSDELKELFPNQDSIAKFITELGYTKYSQNNNFVFYNNNFNLPSHFYTPQNIIQTSNIEKLIEILSQKDNQIRFAVYLEDQNRDNIQEFGELPHTIENSPILEFKKINPTKYRVIVHKAKDNFPLVFSESFNGEWKAYLVEPNQSEFLSSHSQLDTTIQNYNILEVNADFQANKEELNEFVGNGWISTLGYMPYIDFISKNFEGTIQNNNLPEGKFYETWFKEPISEKNHLMVNGYANSWWIDLNDIKNSRNYKQNQDGSIDFELIIEFWPQRIFYLGLFISGLTLFCCVGYLGWNWRKLNKQS